MADLTPGMAKPNASGATDRKRLLVIPGPWWRAAREACRFNIAEAAGKAEISSAQLSGIENRDAPAGKLATLQTLARVYFANGVVISGDPLSVAAKGSEPRAKAPEVPARPVDTGAADTSW